MMCSFKPALTYRSLLAGRLLGLQPNGPAASNLNKGRVSSAREGLQWCVMTWQSFTHHSVEMYILGDVSITMVTMCYGEIKTWLPHGLHKRTQNGRVCYSGVGEHSVVIIRCIRSLWMQ